MGLEIKNFILGPIENNVYLVFDTESKEAVVIDPSFQSQTIIEVINDYKLELKQIWLTHAHFDHFAGIPGLCEGSNGNCEIVLHKDDLPLWEDGGEVKSFGIELPEMQQPSIFVEENEMLKVGEYEFKVLHVPGHTRGHIVFFQPAQKVLFSGDVLFHRGIGRTDLQGGDYKALITGITEKLLTLPKDTIVYSGHGPDTTIGDEIKLNPFL